MTTSTSMVYECSRQTASIKISNSEFINEFTDGIELKKGDTVRLLGSFIQEGSDSNEIELETKQDVNLSYSPFISANTIDTLDKTGGNNLMDLAQIGDLPYSTDAFGINPPMRNTTQKGTHNLTFDGTGYGWPSNIMDWNQNAVPGNNDDPTKGPMYPYKDGDQPAQPNLVTPTDPNFVEKYEDVPNRNPAATGETGGNIYGQVQWNPWLINGTSVQGEDPVYTGGNGIVAARPNMKGDSSFTWGTNLKTDDFQTDKVVQNEGGNDYKHFQNNAVPTELYVGNLMKKFILPVIDRFETGNTDTNPQGNLAYDTWAGNNTSHILEPLMENPPDGGVAGAKGMMAGVPKVGMYICTVDIAQSSGWYDSEGLTYYENTWGATETADYDGTMSGDNGGAPWKFAGGSGYTGIPNLKSGVQSVIGKIIAVRPTKMHILGRTTKCYEIYVSDFINPATLKTSKLISHTFNAKTLTRGDTFSVTTLPKLVYKLPHGAGQTDTNYNFNPSFNNINSADNTITSSNQFPLLDGTPHGFKAGQGSGTPTRQSYLLNHPDASPGPNLLTSVLQGGTAEHATQVQMGLSQAQGLSFLWNGTHNGQNRISREVSNFDRYRANSWLFPYRATGTADIIRLKHLVQDVTLETKAGTYFNRQSVAREQGTVPVSSGAYIICSEETILNITRGVYKSEPGTNFWAQDGFTPRIWLDYSFQTRASQYTTRHYVGNSWNTTQSKGDASGDGSSPTNWQNRWPGNSSQVKEMRYGYNMMGSPPNINWRNSWNNNGNIDPTTASQISAVFHAPVYITDYVYRDETPNGVGFPAYMSSEDGAPTPNGTGIEYQYRNLPIVYGGYNNSINSVYFQQKDSGDCSLGINTWRAKAILSVGSLSNTNTLTIQQASLINIDTGETMVLPSVVDDTTGEYQVKILLDNAQFNPVELIGTITVELDNTYGITLYDEYARAGVAHNLPRWLVDIPQYTECIIYKGNCSGVGAGISATPWSADMIMIKESIMKVEVPAGRYTEYQLGQTINDVLHYNTDKYASEVGTKIGQAVSVPSNVSNIQKTLTSQPSLITGNFVQSYLPDINFGFTPITETNAVDLDQAPQTVDLTNELYIYEPLNNEHYWAETIATERPYNGIDVRKLSDNPTQYPTHSGKHFKIYSIPYISKESVERKELCLLRLRGGALNLGDFPTGDNSNGRWNNVIPRTTGNLEMLRGVDGAFFISDDTQPSGFAYLSTWANYGYRCPLVRNLFPNGGSCRIFVGANNFTLEWEDQTNRFAFNNLYTPLRPHQVVSQSGTTDPNNDFGINDAVPSAIINAKNTGQTISQLTGIYLNNLNSGPFTRANWGTPTPGTLFLYDDDDANQEIDGGALMTVLGFTTEQINAEINSFNIVINPFTFKSELYKNGTAIRVAAKITPSINASNPIASKCLNIAPVQQFFVEVLTDDYFAAAPPKKGSDPYYFIGSDLMPFGFFGNINGSKLPIAGICARNFSAFNFVFDLGGSSILFTVPEDATVFSIRTAIYTSNLKPPKTIDENSSVIYIITKNNFINNLTPEQGVIAAKQMQAEEIAPMVNSFYSQPTNNIRTSFPPIMPPQNSPYFKGFGKIVQPIPPIQISHDSDGDTD